VTIWALRHLRTPPGAVCGKICAGDVLDGLLAGVPPQKSIAVIRPMNPRVKLGQPGTPGAHCRQNYAL
jgi:hypothetical protein